MYRKIFEYLKEWKNSPYRKPLLIQGARQVGKTYSILNFFNKKRTVANLQKVKNSSLLSKFLNSLIFYFRIEVLILLQSLNITFILLT